VRRIRQTAALVLALGLVLPTAAATERLVVDWRTGLAIYGFDPVAYFTDRRPLLGQPEFEHRFAGAVWRFRNPGNLAAFIHSPTTYMPRFGGYDPLGVARGVATPGHPDLWVIVGDGLYFFHDRATRDAFAANPDAARAAAEAKWPEVARSLVP
jgi:hypothetical protein